MTALHSGSRFQRLRHLLLLLASACAHAADPPPVPDPLGLGERLALITELQDTYHIHPDAGETLAQLQQRYAAAWASAQAQGADHQEEAERQQRVERLRRRIGDRFGQTADPALDEAGLLALLHRLEAEQQERAQAALSRPDAGGAERTPPPRDEPHPEAPAHGAAGQAPRKAPTAREPAAQAKKLAFAADGVSECLFWNDGAHALLVVFFGADHNGAFTGLPARTWAIVSQAKDVHRAVALLGHGNGTGIGRQSIEEHLRAHREFYETVGGQLPAQPVECMLFGSCSAQNPDQMAAMRDGIGYYPLRRVAAGSRELMNGAVFLAALTAIVEAPATPAFRGFFRFASPEVAVSSVGEVGADGARGDTVKWTVTPTPGGFVTAKQP